MWSATEQIIYLAPPNAVHLKHIMLSWESSTSTNKTAIVQEFLLHERTANTGQDTLINLKKINDL
jgi:hypothetical protein